MTTLPRITPEQILARQTIALDDDTLATASAIVEDVRVNGTQALRRYAERFNERAPSDPLVLGSDAMRDALEALPRDDRAALQRAHDRIAAFARAQRDAVADLRVPVPGGEAGHDAVPVESAGCYAPAGRYPLPSSVLMTASTARAAGVDRVVVASPGAHPLNLAAAAIAGADQFLAIGGAHSVAALAFGFANVAHVDVIAGPGNRYVTAAKHIVSSSVGIDMLAGPSELLIIADEIADPATIAADLLAQAEHDDDAVPMLITTDAGLPDRIDTELRAQLDILETADTARRAMANGFACTADTIEDAIALADVIAPEHLEIITRDAEHIAKRITNAGAIFIGPHSAEVIGDFGVGPNHTLPTGGTARYQAGLSVTHFLRLRTWLRIDDPSDARDLVEDTRRIAQLEGLDAHAGSAARRAL